MKINIEDGPTMDPEKQKKILEQLLQYNRDYRENKGKIRDLENYNDIMTRSDVFDKVALNSIIIAGLLAIYKLSFINITSIPLLPDKIEILVQKVEEVLAYLGLGSAGVSIIAHVIASFFEKKANVYSKEKGLTVTEIKKYYDDKLKGGKSNGRS